MRTRPPTHETVLRYLAGHLGPPLLKSLGATLRARKLGSERIEEARKNAGNILFAFWHGRLLPLAYFHRNQDINVLVSSHRDGEYVARVIHGLGFGTSRGSSTRGGMRALRELIQAAGRNLDIAVTPDGPRGPRETVQPGVIYLAKRLGLPIIPIGVSSNPSLNLRSWDRFMVPMPFAQCCIVYGEAVAYEGPVSDQALATGRADLEERLRRVTEEADRVCGR